MTNQLLERPQLIFPSDTKVDPKEQCEAITTRTGKPLITPPCSSKGKGPQEKGESSLSDTNVEMGGSAAKQANHYSNWEL
jgi:hypothetical protein